MQRRAACVHDLHVAVHEPDIGTCAQQVDLTPHAPRSPHVVAVQEPDQVTRRGGHDAVRGADEPLVLLAQHGDARVISEGLVEQLARPVSRAVIEHDDVEQVGRVLLAQRALDGLHRELAMVVGQDHARDGGHCWHTSAVERPGLRRIRRPAPLDDGGVPMLGV